MATRPPRIRDWGGVHVLFVISTNEDTVDGRFRKRVVNTIATATVALIHVQRFSPTHRVAAGTTGAATAASAGGAAERATTGAATGSTARPATGATTGPTAGSTAGPATGAAPRAPILVPLQ